MKGAFSMKGSLESPRQARFSRIFLRWSDSSWGESKECLTKGCLNSTNTSEPCPSFPFCFFLISLVFSLSRVSLVFRGFPPSFLGVFRGSEEQKILGIFGVFLGFRQKNQGKEGLGRWEFRNQEFRSQGFGK